MIYQLENHRMCESWARVEPADRSKRLSTFHTTQSMTSKAVMKDGTSRNQSTTRNHTSSSFRVQLTLLVPPSLPWTRRALPHPLLASHKTNYVDYTTKHIATPLRLLLIKKFINSMKQKCQSKMEKHRSDASSTSCNEPFFACGSQCVAVRCSVLQCVAVCCSVLQCVAVCCSVLQCVAVCCCALQCVAVCCSVLQCVAVRCSVLQCVAVRCSALRLLQCAAAQL